MTIKETAESLYATYHDYEVSNDEMGEVIANLRNAAYELINFGHYPMAINCILMVRDLIISCIEDKIEYKEPLTRYEQKLYEAEI